MHLHIVTRGIQHKVKKFIDDLSSQYFPYEDTGRGIALAVRPIQLWELVFPKNALHQVCKTIGTSENMTEKEKIMAAGLRTLLGSKRLPRMDLKNVLPRMVLKNDVAVYPIGYKEDKNWPSGEFKGKEQL